ncbi:MAG: YggS family pyridoxal phosphate-dependent enzyme [Deltaproteobacteria bacterium]|nr:YggS family pyridoxal phosphate-dependent enzyme [Deltaproteobacteria bacterium]
MNSVRENITRIKDRISEAAGRAGRNPAAVRLMAVTKTVEDDRIQAAIEAGITLMGENYVQEAKRKIELMGKDVQWHMIGHLQSNKAKYAVRLFDMIHSVDSLDLARELDRRSREAGRVIDVLLEVNLSGEESKSGCSPDEAFNLAVGCSGFPNLALKGLMTMPPWCEDPEAARPYFRKLCELKERINGKKLPGIALNELSMGMSGDYEVAVSEGATIIRIGTAIFGPRR